jgi:hypothetical protein
MLIVLASMGLIRRHRPINAENSANTITGTVQFQYWAWIGAHTGIGTAAMAFISSMGTFQVPVPVFARSITNNGKYLLPILVNSIVLWKKCG